MVGEGLIVRSSVHVAYPWMVSNRNQFLIDDHAEFYSLGEIDIGNDVVISQYSYVATHDYTKLSCDMIDKKITIEDQIWIATDVFVAPGVKIGRGALIDSPAKSVKPR